MAIYKLEGDVLTELAQTTFSNEHILEASEMQNFVVKSIGVIEPDLFVLATEYGDWTDSRRKIDILCLDKKANFVVVELKRTEDGGHMELQSLRYAAMVSNMSRENAIRAHEKYLKKQGRQDLEAENEITRFLGTHTDKDEFGKDVRIILVSADFSVEITTTVLWLNDRDIDIKCIRIKPQKDGEKLYFDIQQIIPLPEAAEYLVGVRDKSIEQRQARRESNRDLSKFNVTIKGVNYEKLSKRDTMILIVKSLIEAGVSPEEIMPITGDRRWIWVEGDAENETEFAEKYQAANEKSYDASRWFNSDDQLFRHSGKTYVFSNQHGTGTQDLANNLLDSFPQLNASIEISSD